MLLYAVQSCFNLCAHSTCSVCSRACVRVCVCACVRVCVVRVCVCACVRVCVLQRGRALAREQTHPHATAAYIWIDLKAGGTSLSTRNIAKHTRKRVDEANHLVNID